MQPSAERVPRSGVVAPMVAANGGLADHCPMLREAWPTKFDDLFDLGRQAVLTGTHQVDAPPTDDGRWGISVVLRPDACSASGLAEATGELMGRAGWRHWPTGSMDSVHFTVRALEPHRVVVPASDERVARYRTAVRAAAARSRPVELHLRGLTITSSGVLACAKPVDAAADDFSAALREELGTDQWFEETFHRDIWYATLVHFTGPIANPEALVDLVARHRRTELGRVRFTRAELIRASYNGRQMVLVTLAAAAFGGALPHSKA